MEENSLARHHRWGNADIGKLIQVGMVSKENAIASPNLYASKCQFTGWSGQSVLGEKGKWKTYICIYRCYTVNLLDERY